MAQGFDCSCGAKVRMSFSSLAFRLMVGQDCLGRITGAKDVSLWELEKRGWVNEHIWTFKCEQVGAEECGVQDRCG